MDESKPKQFTFEDAYPIIQQELAKRKNKWTLTSIPSIGWEDVCSIITIHIFKKFKQYDPKKPFLPWINRILSNQIINLVRNNYSNFSRPCLKCDAQLPDNGCKIYSDQCSKCPIYADWEKKKQFAYNIKLPLSIENHVDEVHQKPQETSIDLEKNISLAHETMRKYLKRNEWLVYQKLFIQHKDEATAIKELNYIGSNRSKQLFNVKVAIISKFKNLVQKGLIDF